MSITLTGLKADIFRLGFNPRLDIPSILNKQLVMSRQYSSHTNTSPSKSQILTHFCTNTISHLHKYQLGAEMPNCPAMTRSIFCGNGKKIDLHLIARTKCQMSVRGWRKPVILILMCLMQTLHFWKLQSCKSAWMQSAKISIHSRPRVLLEMYPSLP